MRSAVGIVLGTAAAAFAGGCAAWLLAHYAIVTGRVFQRFTVWDVPIPDVGIWTTVAATSAGLWVFASQLTDRATHYRPSSEMIERREQVAKLCACLPLVSTDAIPAERQAELSRWLEEPLGGNGRLTCLTEGRAGAFDIAVFDIAGWDADDDGRYTPAMTVIALLGAACGLPAFTLEPRCLLDRLLGTGLRVRGDRAFARRYLLKPAASGTEAALARAFDADARAWLADNPGWKVRAAAGNLILHRDGVVVPRDERSALIAEAILLSSALTRPHGYAAAPAAQSRRGAVLAMAMRIVVAAVVVAVVLGAAGALFGMLLGGMVGAVVSLCTDDRTGETRALWRDVGVLLGPILFGVYVLASIRGWLGRINSGRGDLAS